MFSFSKAQQRKFWEWLDKHNPICPYAQHGHAASRFTYSFTQEKENAIVAHVVVHCSCSGKVDLGRA